MPLLGVAGHQQSVPHHQHGGQSTLRGNASLKDLCAAVLAAEERHTRLVLVVGTDEGAAKKLIAEFGLRLTTRVANLGLVVAERLINLPARHRPVTAADAAADFIRDAEPRGPALVSNLQLLFLPELMLDPLKLLSDSARSRVVVASWPGERTGSCLRYAAPSHPEFREYHNPDCLVVEAPPPSHRHRI
ncbi:MAG: BREX-3 system P-loop-containing protein BrxF [Phycisphaerae bacterium]|nr:BREX-3 system P-loop-containing protein BrxF [Phycisphaerae bacterium]